MTMAEFESPGDGAATMAMLSMPSGTVTFLFTDIAGSTRLWERHPEAMRPALARHDALLRDAIEAHGGTVFKTVGDAFCAAFQTAPAAIAAALAAQRALAAEPWPAEAPIRVRAGLYTGTADAEGGDYFGPALNRVARLMSAGHGGQTLLSTSTWELVRDELPDGVGLRDLGERRLKDLRRPERVYQLIAPGLPADFPPLATLDARPHNLPVQLTSFVGRERTMAAVKRALGGAHLVTLIGIGGTGKTRLALQVAADLIDDFEDGVWFVDLAPLVDERLVARTVAGALGLGETAGRAIEDVLVDHVRRKRLLVVLDNCEHLVAACAALAERLLREAPGVRILATSREPLAIAGETRLAVAPLAAPDPRRLPVGAGGAAAALAPYAAVRLFVDRAVAVQADFAVTNANAPAVAGICHRLDGIPLALELAAARVRMMPPEAMLERLDQRFRLLTGGSRTALPRQQTLRAAIDWSFDLLSDAEKTLFRRLSVFRGGWTLEAAEGVCAGAGGGGADGKVDGGVERDAGHAVDLDALDIMDLLARLGDKSLVDVLPAGPAPRYRFLETIREYAAEQLAAAGESDDVRDRHLAWHADLMVAFDPSYGNPDYLPWIQRLELEHDNLRAALRWGLGDLARADAVMTIARSISALWTDHGHAREGSDWYAAIHRMARERGLDVSDPRSFGWVNFGRAICLRCCGLSAEAETFLEVAICCFDSASELQGKAWALNQQSVTAAERGDMERAEATVREALTLLRQIGVRPGEVAATINMVGEVARARRDFHQAAACYRECLEISPDDKWAPHNLGQVLLHLVELDEAGVRFRQSLVIAQQWGNPFLLAMTLAGFAGIATARGGPERAARLFGAASVLIERSGGVLEPADQADWDHHLAAARAAVAPEAWDAAWAEGRAMDEGEVLALETATIGGVSVSDAA